MHAGIDTHKETLAVAVLNDLGRPVEVCELPNTPAGFRRLTRLLSSHEVGRIGIEGAGNYGRAVAAHLVAWTAGEQAAMPMPDAGRAGWMADLQVVEVPTGTHPPGALRTSSGWEDRPR